VKLNAVSAVQQEVEAGQWSAVREPLRETEKPMEEMSLGELLYCAVVEGAEKQRLVASSW